MNGKNKGEIMTIEQSDWIEFLKLFSDEKLLRTHIKKLELDMISESDCKEFLGKFVSSMADFQFEDENIK